MAVSKAQQKATAKYESKTYDKTLVRLQKGKLDKIRAHAESQGESINAFITRAIAETIERDAERAADALTQANAGEVSLPAGDSQSGA